MKRFDAILYDLDGTLIHLPQEDFTNGTTALMAQVIAPKLNVDKKIFVKAILSGIEAMLSNNGKMRNDEAFFAASKDSLGGDEEIINHFFNNYYENEFASFKTITKENIYVKKALEESRRLADRVILATQPVFPFTAQEERLSWIGLSHDDFDFVTDYSNSRFCKPSKEYYRDVLTAFSLDPARCLMVGNDISDDILPTLSLGMNAYIVTDCLLNGQLDAPGAMRSDFAQFVNYLSSL